MAKTLAGLAKATARVLQARMDGASRADGMFMGMWLLNARFAARTTFGNVQDVLGLEQRYAVTSAQDLIGGKSLFGYPADTTVQHWRQCPRPGRDHRRDRGLVPDCRQLVPPIHHR